MENRVKLSDFRMVSRYRIADKMLTKIEENKVADKEIEFYTFSSDDLKELEEAGKESTENFILKLIEKTTNVIVDMNIEEFKFMCNKSASLTFKSFIKKLLEFYNELVADAVRGQTVEEGIKETITEFNKLIPNVPKEKTREERIQEIEKEIEACQDINKCKELQKEKEELLLKMIDK